MSHTVAVQAHVRACFTTYEPGFSQENIFGGPKNETIVGFAVVSETLQIPMRCHTPLRMYLQELLLPHQQQRSLTALLIGKDP